MKSPHIVGAVLLILGLIIAPATAAGPGSINEQVKFAFEVNAQTQFTLVNLDFALDRTDRDLAAVNMDLVALEDGFVHKKDAKKVLVALRELHGSYMDTVFDYQFIRLDLYACGETILKLESECVRLDHKPLTLAVRQTRAMHDEVSFRMGESDDKARSIGDSFEAFADRLEKIIESLG